MRRCNSILFNVLATGLLYAIAGAVSGQSGQTFQFQESPAQGSGLDMSVSGSRLLEEELGGGSGDAGSQCQAMLQQLDAMRNEPLRRNALWERYRAQCQGGLDGMPTYVPPMPQ